MYDSCYTSDKTEAFLFAKLISKLRYIENVKVDATKKQNIMLVLKLLLILQKYIRKLLTLLEKIIY